MHPIDTMVFTAILDHQNKQNWVGGLAEIGVFYGRSLSLIAKYLKPGQEKALGMDLFDIDENAGADSDQLSYVKRHLMAEKNDQHVVLMKKNSAELKPSDITSIIGNVRFFSIDGGHELKDLLNDSTLALKTLTQEGVIAFDDFFNPQYPDVTIGVLEFMKSHTDIVPFCITKNKLYVCRASQSEQYLTAMTSALLWGNAYQENFSFLGHTICHWSQSLLNRIIYQKCAELGLGGIGEYFTSNVVRKFNR